MTDLFFDRTTVVLQKVLDGAATRQQVLADNIANADTPGYTRQDVTFEGALQSVLSTPDADPDQQVAELAAVPVAVNEDTDAARRVDGNNVDMEREMATMAKNHLEYETSAQMLTIKLRTLNLAIHEGRR